jgi:hypothetical protein
MIRATAVLAAALAVAGCGGDGGGDAIPVAIPGGPVSAPVPTGFGLGVANHDARGYRVEMLWADAAGAFHADPVFALGAASSGAAAVATALYSAAPDTWYFLTITDGAGVSVDAVALGPLRDGEFVLSHWRVVGGTLLPVQP